MQRFKVIRRRRKPKKRKNPYGPDSTCPVCGLKYKDFRTGESYSDVYSMFWSADPNYESWSHKRRNTILGKWRQIKQSGFYAHIQQCEEREKWEREGGVDETLYTEIDEY